MIGFHKNNKKVKRQHPVMLKRRLEEDEPENILFFAWNMELKYGNEQVTLPEKHCI